MDILTIDEWHSILRDCKDKSTLGASNIGYKLIKKVSSKEHACFIRFAEIIFNIALFPDE